MAQRRLAREVTATVHGEAAADQAIETSAALFGGTGPSGLVPEVFRDMPARSLRRGTGSDRIPVVELLVASGLASSKADARRGIQGKGFYLNGEAIESPDLLVGDDAMQGPPEERFVILRKGKKNYVRLVIEG